MKTIPYHKLVRDRIPEIIEAAGKTPITEVLSHDDYLVMLQEKLDEEVQEFHETQSIDELADLVEVIYAILDFRCVPHKEFEELRQLKQQRRGAFQKRLLLTGVIEKDEVTK
jgi:predicted house-cleaning noncanonical NTP pyrophosphatase (MazG superfamily)